MVACSKNTCFEGVKKLQNFGTLCVLILKVHFQTLENFGHFNATFMNNHKAYYKGGSDNPSQVQVVCVNFK
jgi:hypothetical protein